MRPGRVKRADLVYFLVGVVVIVALVIWAVW